jgi:hypothetical protein
MFFVCFLNFFGKKKVFLKAIADPQSSGSNLLPAYIAAIVARGPQSEFQSYFSQLVCSCPNHDDLTGLRLAIELLSARSPQIIESVFGVLRELVVAPELRVKEVTASLLERLASLSSESSIRQAKQKQQKKKKKKKKRSNDFDVEVDLFFVFFSIEWDV